MTFRAPSLSTYFISLTIAGIIGGLIWFAIGNTTNTLLLLMTGLIIGHFFGSFFINGEQPERPTAKTSSTPANGTGGEIKSIYVGNVAFSAPREDLQALFETHGKVISVRLMTDRVTRRPRGYGFVEMEGQAADAAIAALDGMEFFGRNLRVNEAKQRAPHREV